MITCSQNKVWGVCEWFFTTLYIIFIGVLPGKWPNLDKIVHWGKPEQRIYYFKLWIHNLRGGLLVTHHSCSTNRCYFWTFWSFCFTQTFKLCLGLQESQGGIVKVRCEKDIDWLVISADQTTTGMMHAYGWGNDWVVRGWYLLKEHVCHINLCLVQLHSQHCHLATLTFAHHQLLLRQHDYFGGAIQAQLLTGKVKGGPLRLRLGWKEHLLLVFGKVCRKSLG